MAFTFRFPDVGEGIVEGEIVRWLVHEGDRVQLDQPLVEVETDKAVVEIPAPRAGTILRLGAREGEKIRVGDVLVVIAEEGEAAEAPPAPAVVGRLESTARDLPPPPEVAKPQVAPKRRPLAIPSVRKLARDLGVDLTQVTPTGPHGRIRREDVLRAAAPAAAPAAPAEEAERDAYGPIRRQPLPALRRTIAEAMVRAAQTAVPITTTDEVDVTELVSLWRRSKEAAQPQGVNLTLLPFIMKATVAALRQHPHLNATLSEDQRQLILKDYYHLGIATDTPDGLIVPVVKDVDRKDLLTLAREVQRLAEQARSRRIALAELRGATFTISNYGTVGGLFATPMLHLPQVAILGVGKLVEKPLVHAGTVAVRWVLPLSLTFDHRALDGAAAQRFLNTLMDYLAEPSRLLLVL
ncbi:MAG: dihydrolipoamide acetyltransferase component of pyruvate dehydrogenase complex [Candidatus Tectimicrobiota bacterium]|nr:MAG: dihydrolipoamide acetyltransferase component of pyruvate dehydrogenase complex [Candidatus Tectomicrobia bacterium]